MFDCEEERIREAYSKRMQSGSDESLYFAYTDRAHLARVQERHRMTLALLAEEGVTSLSSLRILDVGCGKGDLLRQLTVWGALPKDLAGVDLRSDTILELATRLLGSDLKPGSATQLPWENSQFDLVFQQTAFSSMPSASMRASSACEIRRVLRPGGIVVWYDIRVPNPQNPDVHAISRKEIGRLFPGMRIRARSVTVVPHVARRLPVLGFDLSHAICGAFPFVRTHLIAAIR